MFKQNHLDFAQIMIYIMIAFVLVTYVVLVVWYWQNKVDNSGEYFKNPLYCESVSDCTWQEESCNNCKCPEPRNKTNLFDLDCSVADANPVCLQICETGELDCVKNTCVAKKQKKEFDQKYLDDSLYCENKEDCIWQTTDCGGCTCPEPVNKYNQTKTTLDCADFDPGLSCELACEHANLECMNNTCVGAKRGDEILVSYPWKDNSVPNSFTIRGQARGSWFFEGSFPFDIYDKDDKLILQSYVTATENWMTDDWVPFEAEVNINPSDKRGYIIFKKDNPSGLPEHDDSHYLYIRFAEADKFDYNHLLAVHISKAHYKTWKLVSYETIDNVQIEVYKPELGLLDDEILNAPKTKTLFFREGGNFATYDEDYKQSRRVDPLTGQWEIEDRVKAILSVDIGNIYQDKYEIVELEDDLLKLKPLEYLDPSTYCTDDSECVLQATCSCGCPTAVNKESYTDILCLQDEEFCDLWCPETTPKCIANKCTAINVE